MYVKVWAVFCYLFAKNVQPSYAYSITSLMGGDKALDYSHPYMASLQVFQHGNWQHICGAVLIATNKLVTAAHCFDIKYKNTRIKIGTMDLVHDGPKNKYSQTIDVEKIIIHPKFKKGVPRNDIAVVYLTQSVIVNENVKTAEIAPKGISFDGKTCVITGWGISEESPKGSSYLRDAYLKVISTDDCDEYDWNPPITQQQICAWGDNKDPQYRARECKGDSGGALMCGLQFGLLTGVASVGGKDCSGDVPSVFTRVSEYMNWINSAQ